MKHFTEEKIKILSDMIAIKSVNEKTKPKWPIT